MNASYLILAFVLSFGAIALFRFLNLGAIFSVDATMPIFIVMFGVFIHLLNKWVLEPVGLVMEKRREKIQADIEAGSTARATANEVVGAYHAHIQAARHQGQALTNEVTAKAQQARQAEIQRLIQQGNAKLEAAKQEIAAERTAVVSQLVDDEKELVTTIVKKLIGGSASVYVDPEKARIRLVGGNTLMEPEQFKAIAAVVDWVLLIVLLTWLYRKHVPPILAARKVRIELSLKDALEAKGQGEKFLAQQRELVAKQEEEAQRILDEAKQLAAQLEQDAKAQTAREIADLQRKIQSSIDTERQLAITQLRAAAARASLKLTEQVLPSLMTPEVRSQLLSQFVEQLDEAAEQQGPKISAGHLESIH